MLLTTAIRCRRLPDVTRARDAPSRRLAEALLCMPFFFYLRSCCSLSLSLSFTAATGSRAAALPLQPKRPTFFSFLFSPDFFVLFLSRWERKREREKDSMCRRIMTDFQTGKRASLSLVMLSNCATAGARCAGSPFLLLLIHHLCCCCCCYFLLQINDCSALWSMLSSARPFRNFNPKIFGHLCPSKNLKW